MSGLSVELERSFVATSYLLDRRNNELTEPLRAPSAAANTLVRGLQNPDRRAKAAVLAAEVAKIVTSVEAWRIR